MLGDLNEGCSAVDDETTKEAPHFVSSVKR
jgi:hypothetical protein